MSRVSALILAGSRPGGDPLALTEGVPQKALIAIEGRPMLHHVVTALKAVPEIGRIAVSSPEPLPGDGFEWIASRETPSLSVSAALDALGTPLLVTTADHPLLKPKWIAHFLAHSPPGASAVVGLAKEAAVQAAAPETKRTYLRLGGQAWSGCNLFLLADPQARQVVGFWRRLEAHRKKPWRMASLIGPGAILAYLTGRLRIEGALSRIGRLTGATVGMVDMPFGEAAIDVDKPSDLVLVRRLMAARR
ncbi:molybdenum cofactor guanylyltransferase [Aureimonas psammosilenae]|uniref:molybdenum cofactor guanylyltransferase n=1 Tax=Aureimonas psammosilenae TaxID=2495496 RepID=UPI0012611211|nr:nucleotidyltransferase family protein [Aureimonas psammosilenae]